MPRPIFARPKWPAGAGFFFIIICCFVLPILIFRADSESELDSPYRGQNLKIAQKCHGGPSVDH